MLLHDKLRRYDLILASGSPRRRQLLKDAGLTFGVITADTTVIAEGNVLGKPVSVEHASDMLRLLSGKWHTVITGVTIRTCCRTHSFSVSTRVKFKELTDEEISYYIEKYSPMDKAGSYGIQEWIGYIGIEAIDGSYYNVVGLPIQRLCTELDNMLKE